MRLRGSLPATAAQRIRRLSAALRCLSGNQAVRLQRHIFWEMEEWLDRGLGPQHLIEPEVAKILSEAIRHRESTDDWTAVEFVIMPNHLHLFFGSQHDDLPQVLVRFKQWTGGRAARILALAGGHFWQSEWFDHWSRSPAEDERILQYMRDNPVGARLVDHWRNWPYASWAG